MSRTHRAATPVLLLCGMLPLFSSFSPAQIPNVKSTDSRKALPRAPVRSRQDVATRTFGLRPKVQGQRRPILKETPPATFVPQFFDTPGYSVETWPIAVVTADFNLDGKPDLAIASGNGPVNGGNILLGNGDGTFQVHEGFLGGSIAVGDFNNDGKPDLALSDSTPLGSSSITIHLGNGDGTFQAPVSYTLAASSGQLIVGDFNGDGKADLAVANSFSYTSTGAGVGNVSVLLGNGDGTFQSAKGFPSGNSPASLATGDFNGDGKADLAVVDWDRGIGDVSYVDVLLGNGDGTFQNFVAYPTGTSATNVAVASLRRNGKADLIVSCDDVTVRVLLGNGDGTFQPAVAYGTYAGTCCGPPIIADFNRDGNLDIAFVDGGGFMAGVLLGNGDGTFGTELLFGTGNFPYAVAAADFNGDGKLDLVTADWWSSTVSMLCGNGDGTFQARADYPVPGTVTATGLADFNHDGNLDLAVVTPCGTTSGCPAGTVSILSGNGDDTFGPPRTYASGSGASSIAFGDFNKDGKLDLVTGNYFVDGDPVDGGDNFLGISILPGNGDGTFQSHMDYAGGQTASLGYSENASIAIADLNGDGNLDVVATGPGLGAIVWLGNGDGTFQSGVAYTNIGGASSALVLGDFNGDGKPDLAVANGTQHLGVRSDGLSTYLICAGTTVSVLLGLGDGTFGPPASYKTFSDPETLAVGDLNGDGKLDLVAVSPTCSSTDNSDHVSILLGNGDGTFQNHQDFLVEGTEYVSQPLAVSTGDFNLDGRLDIVVGSGYFYGMVRLLLGNGDGSFQVPVAYGTGGNPATISVGDLDNNGKPDLVTANHLSGTVSVLRNIQGPDFSVRAAGVSPITAGQSASSSVTISSILRFSNSVALGCSVSLTSGSGTAPTCSLSPASVQLAANGTATSTLTINSSTSAAAFNDAPFGQDGGKHYALLLSISGLVFVMVCATRIHKSGRVGLFASVLLAVVVFQPSCGVSSGGPGGGGGRGNPPSNATYTVTVTATSGSVIRNTALTVILQ